MSSWRWWWDLKKNLKGGNSIRVNSPWYVITVPSPSDSILISYSGFSVKDPIFSEILFPVPFYSSTGGHMQIRIKLWGAIIFRFQGRLGWSKEQRAKKHHVKLRKPQKKIEIGQYRRAGGYLQRGGLICKSGFASCFGGWRTKTKQRSTLMKTLSWAFITVLPRKSGLRS